MSPRYTDSLRLARALQEAARCPTCGLPRLQVNLAPSRQPVQLDPAHCRCLRAEDASA